jgi:septal ring factor EnvC (AmiA/AmiB activator)
MNQQPNNEKQQKQRVIIIIQSALNVVLLLLLSFFSYNYFKTDHQLLDTEEKLVSTEDARAELDSILKYTELELEQYKGKNAQLDEFLRQKNDSLQEFADRIEALLKQGKVTRMQLAQANDELDKLRYYKKKYLLQIDSLNNVIVSLNAENQTLKSDINRQKRKYEDLTMENVRLSTKVAIGAKLNAQNIFVTGIKMRSNGKERETMRVSQIEQLKISFYLEQNYVAEKGAKEIFVRIIGPDGATVYNEAAGSGTFKYQNEEYLYSRKSVIEFTQEGQQVVIYWTKGSDFLKGNYKAELYCEGFLIGKSDFELK